MFYDILVVGSGPAGCTAAIYAGRDNFSVGVLEGNLPGGLLTTTTIVENFPGFIDGIDGFELVSNMKKQARKYGVNFMSGIATNIRKKNSEFEILTSSGDIIKAKSVIISSGSSPKKLKIESEAKFWSKGVHSCATCDGFFYKNKVIGVIGGGDSAMEEAHFLAKIATKVYVFTRSDKQGLKATTTMQQKTFSLPNVEHVPNVDIIEFIGDDKLKSVKINNNITNEQSTVELDGVFLAIGHTPNTDYLKGFADLLPTGNLKVTNNVYTSVEGLFSAGDVSDLTYRQAITSAGFGCMAAIVARKYLQQ